jgi:choline dehydrogenase-like flavoprotein
MSQHFDYVIVGAGIVGAIMARYLGQAGRRVLVLDAGTGGVGEPAGYERLVADYYTQLAKVPNSPYPPNPFIPSPSVLDIPPDLATFDGSGWYVPHPLPTQERKTQRFGSDYLRMVGGTTLHWLGTCLRMLPSDFHMQTAYGRGVDWPIGYVDLLQDYAAAEWEIGVSADVGDQSYLGVEFPAGYHYPMQRIPPTVVDQTLGRAVNGMKVRLADDDYEVRVINTPQGRNSVPNPGYLPRGAVRIVRYEEHARAGHSGRPAGALQHGKKGNARAYFEHTGERCEGNSSCIPICPVQAKYNALKTLAWALRTSNVEVWPRCLVTRVRFGADGKVVGLDYKDYGDPAAAPRALPVKAGHYVLALNAIENAKLMLASYEEDLRFRRDESQLGRNLMDHPFVMAWGLAREPLGTFRGPSSTAGIETLRDGAFRSRFAPFRIEVGNWGWDLANNDPYGTAMSLIHGERSSAPLFGARLRERLRFLLQREVRLGALIEQLPDARNRVTVSREWKSPFGEYRPVIDYRLGDYERAAFDAYLQVSRAVFARAGVTDCTDWDNPNLAGQRIIVDGKQAGVYKWVGAGHLVGTHRMGTSVRDGVVDTYQRSFVHKNLFLAGAGSMCTIGTSNPTLTLAALTFRTLRHILGTFRTEVPQRMAAGARQ